MCDEVIGEKQSGGKRSGETRGETQGEARDEDDHDHSTLYIPSVSDGFARYHAVKWRLWGSNMPCPGHSVDWGIGVSVVVTLKRTQSRVDIVDLQALN